MTTVRERVREHLLEALDNVVKAGFELVGASDLDKSVGIKNQAYFGGHISAVSSALTRTLDAMRSTGVE